MTRQRTFPLKILLSIPSAVFALGAMGMAYLGAIQHQRTTLLGLVQQCFLVNEESISRKFESLLDQPQEVTAELAEAKVFQGDSEALISERLRAVLRSRPQIDYEVIARASPQRPSSIYQVGRTAKGQLLTLPNTVNGSQSDLRPWVQKILGVAGPTWHLLPLSTPAGAAQVLVHIRPLGDRQGVIGAGVSLSRLQEILEQQVNRSIGYVAVIDRDGQIIAAANRLPLSLKAADTPQKLNSSNSTDGIAGVISRLTPSQAQEITI
ncbi:MAG: hypothetical protein HC919_14305, partial [Oscillatoriales cyanobacterium SM2_2_1]|nr:hypothetical protein [Oscillatoriales cyanobacterium SM2_2_1]